MLPDKLPQTIFADSAIVGQTRNFHQSSLKADVRIEAGSGSRN
jgi:hypothetical protein